MFEKIKCQLMTRHFNKKAELANQFSGAVCPKIRSKVSKNAEFANICYPMPAGQGVFQVMVKDYQHIVDLRGQTCDCRRWQLTGIPCSHAISCLRHERIPAESVILHCYSIQAYNQAYGFSIWPCRDKSLWEATNGPQVLPPVYEKKVGRPPKSRRKQPMERQGKNGPTMSKHGSVMHCSHCSEAGHNSHGCKLKKMGFSSQEAKELVARTSAALQAEKEQAATNATNDQEANDQPTNEYTGEGTSEQQGVHAGTENLEGREELPLNQEMRQEAPMLSQMSTQAPAASMLSQPQGSLPDCQYIMDNQVAARPMPLTTCTKAGRGAAAKKNTTNKAGRSKKQAVRSSNKRQAFKDAVNTPNKRQASMDAVGKVKKMIKQLKKSHTAED